MNPLLIGPDTYLEGSIFKIGNFSEERKTKFLRKACNSAKKPGILSKDFLGGTKVEILSEGIRGKFKLNAKLIQIYSY